MLRVEAVRAWWRRRRPWVAPAAGAVVGAALPFVCATTAWPEVVAPAYFIDLGLVMYRDILFPHTPVLAHLTAAAGALLGFSAATLRAVVALAAAATCALVAGGAGRRGDGRGAGAGVLIGAPLVLCWTAYADGPALWPDHFAAPVLLAAALALARFERTGRAGALAGGGLLLGGAVLIKQTSAWVALAGVAWLLLASRRRRPARVALLAAAVCAPYLAFVAGWAVDHAEWSHLRWTLLVPLQMGAAGDNVRFLDGEQNLEMLPLALALAACLLARTAAGVRPACGDPAMWLFAGCLGMTYPRGGPIHWAASVGLASLLLVRSVGLLRAAATRWARGRLVRLRVACMAGGVACALVSGAVAALGGGDLLAGRLGGPTFYWDDAESSRLAAVVAAHVAPGQEVLLYNLSRDTLYARLGLRPPGGIYVNTGFWDCLNKEGSDERLVAALAARPGLRVLHREPDAGQHELRATRVYRFLATRTATTGVVDRALSWRRVLASDPASPP